MMKDQHSLQIIQRTKLKRWGWAAASSVAMAATGIAIEAIINRFWPALWALLNDLL